VDATGGPESSERRGSQMPGSRRSGGIVKLFAGVLFTVGIGVLAYPLAYQGMRDTTSWMNAIPVPPAAGGIALAGGIVLLFGKRN
jgi:hypothetical protein